MAETSAEDPVLTLDQGCIAAYCFLRQFYERDARKPESMFFLLSSMELNGPRMSSDPAQWHDWLASVAKAIESGATETFDNPLPEPLSK